MKFNIKSIFKKFPYKQNDNFLFYDSGGLVYNPTIERWLVKLLYKCYAYDKHLPSGTPENQEEMLATILAGCRLDDIDELERTLAKIDFYRGRKARKFDDKQKLSGYVRNYFKEKY